MHYWNCDVCGQPATWHDTVLKAGESFQRHLCRAHARELGRQALPGVSQEFITSWLFTHAERPQRLAGSFSDFKRLLMDGVDRSPANWLPSRLSREELKQRIAAATTLDELSTAFDSP